MRVGVGIFHPRQPSDAGILGKLKKEKNTVNILFPSLSIFYLRVKGGSL